MIKNIYKKIIKNYANTFRIILFVFKAFWCKSTFCRNFPPPFQNWTFLKCPFFKT